MCGEYYFIIYEDENGIWCVLFINDVVIDIGYMVFFGGYYLFIVNFYFEVYFNKLGCYCFFYEVMFDVDILLCYDILMMIEF